MPSRPRPLVAPTLPLIFLATLLSPSPAAGQAVAVDPALLPAWQVLTTFRDREGRNVGESYAYIANRPGSGSPSARPAARTPATTRAAR